MTTPRIGVIGAGIIGLAVGRRLAEVVPGAEITVLDKEGSIAAHQTSHNSGVVHAGVYYAPGSLKARLCRRGMTLLKEYCGARGLPYEECGKLVVARDALEVSRLEEIERRAHANGVPRLRRLRGSELTDIEPGVRGLDGLHSPYTAIVDFAAVARTYAADITAVGGSVRLGFAVDSILRRHGETRITSASGENLAFDELVVCAGLHSDRLAHAAGEARDPIIVPFRGEYQRLVPEREGLVRGLIYPVPDPRYPFLGVHFTRRVGGGVDIGPNAVLAFAREGYRRRDVSLADMRESLAAPGFRRLARRHWRMGVREIHGSISRRAFVAEARTFLPELRLEDVRPAPAGVRAQALDPDGSLVDDFRISRHPGITHVRNAPSPAATSSLAIAEYIVEQICDGA